MKYTFDNFIKEYNYERRKKSNILKIDKRPLHKRMKHLLTYISYFMRYIYDHDIKIKYTSSEHKIRCNKELGSVNDSYTMHNISFSTDKYYCIMEVGWCIDGFAALSIRLYDNSCGLKTLATESITLERVLMESYMSYLNKTANILAKKLFSTELMAYFYLQGLFLREVILDWMYY